MVKEEELDDDVVEDVVVVVVVVVVIGVRRRALLLHLRGFAGMMARLCGLELEKLRILSGIFCNPSVAALHTLYVVQSVQ